MSWTSTAILRPGSLSLNSMSSRWISSAAVTSPPGESTSRMIAATSSSCRAARIWRRQSSTGSEVPSHPVSSWRVRMPANQIRTTLVVPAP